LYDVWANCFFLNFVFPEVQQEAGTLSLYTLRNAGMTKRKKDNRQTSVGLLDGGRKVGGDRNKQSGWWDGEGTAGILTS
ncbi:hypothetical protein, partial [Streptococcus anginosus]|uniref:hypothetical protein n=1 Tax=Streptococcus anginosus TaxID=1328 RepID=UPI002EDB0223